MIICQITFTSDDRIWGAKKTLDRQMSLASFEEMVAIVRYEMFKDQSIPDGPDKGKKAPNPPIPEPARTPKEKRAEREAQPVGTGDFVFTSISIAEKIWKGETVRAVYCYTEMGPWNKKGVWLPPDKWVHFIKETEMDVENLPEGKYPLDKDTYPTLRVLKADKTGKYYVGKVLDAGSE